MLCTTFMAMIDCISSAGHDDSSNCQLWSTTRDALYHNVMLIDIKFFCSFFCSLAGQCYYIHLAKLSVD